MRLNLIDHAKNIFSFNRSITGQGIRETLSYFENIHPEFKRIEFPSGMKVFDWEIPLEWNINEAYLQHIKTGRKYAELRESNLHIVGYSEPIDLILELDDLKNKIHTLYDQPELIPYVTSYYKRDWGFCMPHKLKESLPEGEYKVFIDSNFSNGTLDLSHALIKGKSSKELFFSSYVCHPGMVNNELSGPVVLNALLDYVKKKYKKNNYTYRFVLLPETIGSIAYLSKNIKKMKENIICAFNLSCVGDERCFSHLQSPYGNNLADLALSSALIGLDNVKTYSYLKRGSDERQYCSPGVDLPLCTFSRSKFGEYPEYHTSADNFSLVTNKGLEDSFNIIRNIIDAFEFGIFPVNNFACEPQLGKRGLYPNLSKKSNIKRSSENRMNILAYCNGKNSIFDICKFVGLNLITVLEELKLLRDNQLIIIKQDD